MFLFLSCIFLPLLARSRLSPHRNGLIQPLRSPFHLTNHFSSSHRRSRRLTRTRISIFFIWRGGERRSVQRSINRTRFARARSSFRTFSLRASFAPILRFPCGSFNLSFSPFLLSTTYLHQLLFLSFFFALHIFGICRSIYCFYSHIYKIRRRVLERKERFINKANKKSRSHQGDRIEGIKKKEMKKARRRNLIPHSQLRETIIPGMLHRGLV